MRLLVLGIITLGACVTQRVEAPLRQGETPPTPTPVLALEPRSETCVPFAGEASNCCPSRLGLDPELVRDRCGWSEYLGERSELGCVHVFRDREGEPVELRITPIVGLTLARALELHERGFIDLDPALVEREVWTASGGEITWTGYEGRRWAFVPGWPEPRRVGWQTRDCADEPMLEVLRQMSEAPIDPAGAIALPRLDVDLDAATPRTGLLARAPKSSDWSGDPTRARLPDDAPAFADALIDRVAADDLEGLLALLAPEARWGLPDRRQIAGRPIGATLEQARPAFVALAHAAARMASDTPVNCPAPDRRLRAALARGELLQWCYWVSDDRLDVLALGLRSVEGHARLEYLGLFPERPSEPIEASGEAPVPPSSPRPPVVCGDPHQHDVEHCPELAEPDSELAPE